MECELSKWAKNNIKCCQCEGSLADSKHLNIVATDKVAKWNFPAGSNILIPNAPPTAVGIICDKCANSGDIKIKYVIEAEPGYTKVTYHEIESLEDEPEWVKKAKEKLSRPSPILN